MSQHYQKCSKNNLHKFEDTEIHQVGSLYPIFGENTCESSDTHKGFFLYVSLK